MATYAATGSRDFEPCPAGTHLAVCTLIADVGLQPGSGKFPDPKVLVYFRWEIPSERVTYEKDGKEIEAPAIVHNNYAAFMSPKANLRKAVDAWRGKPFINDAEAEQYDIHKLLGQTCMLLVVHSADGKYANVKGVMAAPKGTAKLKPEGKVVYYGPDDDSQYEDLPTFLQTKVTNQLDPVVNAKAAQSKPKPPANVADAFADAEAARQEDDDDIPF